MEKPKEEKQAGQSKPEQRTEQKKAQKADKVIYLGPSMLERSKDGQLTFSINYGTLYSNGLPADVMERMKADKDFAKLFVPVANAAAAMKNLMKPDSELSDAIGKVKKGYLERKRGGR